MNKSFLAIAIFSVFLTACTTATKTEVVKDPNELPAGTFEPVSGSGASQDSYSWPSDIQSTSMPATMK